MASSSFVKDLLTKVCVRIIIMNVKLKLKLVSIFRRLYLKFNVDRYYHTCLPLGSMSRNWVLRR